MKLRTILAATVIGALAAPGAAMAQTPPVNGGTDIGGTVNSFLELILTQPAKGFAAFSKTKSYEMSFDAQITATDPARSSRSPTAMRRAGPSSGTCRSAPSACPRRSRRRSASPRSSRWTARWTRC